MERRSARDLALDDGLRPPVGGAALPHLELPVPATAPLVRGPGPGGVAGDVDLPPDPRLHHVVGLGTGVELFGDLGECDVHPVALGPCLDPPLFWWRQNQLPSAVTIAHRAPLRSTAVLRAASPYPLAPACGARCARTCRRSRPALWRRGGRRVPWSLWKTWRPAPARPPTSPSGACCASPTGLPRPRVRHSGRSRPRSSSPPSAACSPTSSCRSWRRRSAWRPVWDRRSASRWASSPSRPTS